MKVYRCNVVIFCSSLFSLPGCYPLSRSNQPLPICPLGRALFVNCFQRTQTQQLLKEYLMSALGSTHKSPKEELPKSVEKYDKRFRMPYDYFMKRLKDDAARKKMRGRQKTLGHNKEKAQRNFIFFEMMFKQNRTAIPILISQKYDGIAAALSSSIAGLSVNKKCLW